MKNIVACLLTLLVVSFSGFAAAQETRFSGEIMDSTCAKAGSHTAMMKTAGVTTAKECSQACVKMGSKYVLFDKSTKKVYQLDDQTKAEQLAGEMVTVKGTLNPTGDTIQVTGIEPAAAGK